MQKHRSWIFESQYVSRVFSLVKFVWLCTQKCSRICCLQTSGLQIAATKSQTNLKAAPGFYWILATKRHFVANSTRTWISLSLRVLEIFTWFLVQMKAENPYFSNSKVFYPLTSFLPPFFEKSDFVNFEVCKNPFSFTKIQS